MKFPKLKNPGLCRLTPYVVVIGAAVLAGGLLWSFDFIPPYVAGFGCIGIVILLLIYIANNFMVLMGMDIALASLRANQKARKSFPLNTSEKTIRRHISFLGKEYPSMSLEPKPDTLRYRCDMSGTTFYKCIERKIAVYSVSYLDRSEYKRIMRSARANFTKLTGTKKPLLMDKVQKKSPVCNCSFAVIFADSVDIRLSEELYKQVCLESGDGNNTSVLACVIDKQNRKCVFDSEKIPYYGFNYAAKSRVINMIRRYVFGGFLPLKGNNDRVDPILEDHLGLNEDSTVWELWSKMYKELVRTEKENKRMFSSMSHGQVKEKNKTVYCKVNKSFVCLAVEYKENSCVTVEEPYLWDHPKVNKISKQNIEYIKSQVTEYYMQSGYTVNFESIEE